MKNFTALRFAVNNDGVAVIEVRTHGVSFRVTSSAYVVEEIDMSWSRLVSEVSQQRFRELPFRDQLMQASENPRPRCEPVQLVERDNYGDIQELVYVRKDKMTELGLRPLITPFDPVAHNPSPEAYVIAKMFTPLKEEEGLTPWQAAQAWVQNNNLVDEPLETYSTSGAQPVAV